MRTPTDFREALKRSKMEISDTASETLNKSVFILEKKDREYELVLTSAFELGFLEDTAYEDICKRAKDLGLHMCPPEIGPLLRLQYTDQRGWYLSMVMVAMDSVDLKDGEIQSIFFVSSNKDCDLEIDIAPGYRHFLYDADELFVFLRNK